MATSKTYAAPALLEELFDRNVREFDSDHFGFRGPIPATGADGREAGLDKRVERPATGRAGTGEQGRNAQLGGGLKLRQDHAPFTGERRGIGGSAQRGQPSDHAVRTKHSRRENCGEGVAERTTVVGGHKVCEVEQMRWEQGFRIDDLDQRSNRIGVEISAQGDIHYHANCYRYGYQHSYHHPNANLHLYSHPNPDLHPYT